MAGTHDWTEKDFTYEVPPDEVPEREERHTQDLPHKNRDLALGMTETIEDPYAETVYGIERHKGKFRRAEEGAGTAGEAVHVSIRCPICDKAMVQLDQRDLSAELAEHMAKVHDVVTTIRTP